MSPFGHAEFLLAAHDLKDLPPDSGTEIAFAGRSNSGKSSAINALVGRKRLAFSSKTPGRTQTINYYDLGQRRYFVDLPGYGYASVPAAERRHWALLISAYLQTRQSLRGLVVIMDARRPFTDLDCQLLEWFAPTGKPVHALLSKSDKLTRQQASASLRGAEASCARYPRCTVQLYSATAGTGVRAAQAALARWMK